MDNIIRTNQIKLRIISIILISEEKNYFLIVKHLVIETVATKYA